MNTQAASMSLHSTMPPMRDNPEDTVDARMVNNPDGSNGHGGRLLNRYPQLLVWIQKYIDEGVKQANMPQALSDDHGVSTSLRTVERYIKDYHLRTTRHPQVSVEDQGAAILAITAEDPLGTWGGRKVKEKLGLTSIHIPRRFIDMFRAAHDANAAALRRPGARKVHTRGLFASGLDEEWCIDGHEKILNSMGISVYGIINKFSRRELLLRAVPDSRTADVPPALYLQLVRQLKGIPIQTVTDKGSETGKLAALQTSLRQLLYPDLSLEIVPAHRSVKSVYNITCERGWRPIWEKELANVKHEYESGKVASGFHPDNPIHEGVCLWLWGRIVQLRLDKIQYENGIHRVRKQASRLLPTGGRIIDFYEHPERYGGDMQLISIDDIHLPLIDHLIEEHSPAEKLQFGSNDMVVLCEAIFAGIGSPDVSALNGWAVFSHMIAKYNEV
ncbi:unnamed protein product [Mycena citricolor]|uniref:Integrase core domain-containing protein n=1 Tax=Mycena citricolor TaxID=2018698 RepID=A0AAD2JZF5_9AGAR|nr:unnamed protein product [Mycena citricolor]